MNKWQIYTGTGTPHDVKLPQPPPWRKFGGRVLKERTIPVDVESEGSKFQTTTPMVEAVNAALYLRRPLLLTGRPGSGKSSLIESVARELKLGRVLRWHITSGSTLQNALYRYDAIGRLQAHELTKNSPIDKNRLDIGDYLSLGPMGTALLPTNQPRALLVDEIDKSDIDMPSDLLNVFERGEFEIPELTRLKVRSVDIREDGGGERFPIVNGKVQCRHFPFVVLTSNGERDFPAPFLRRCIRFTMPPPTSDLLMRIVSAHLGKTVARRAERMVQDFAERSSKNHALATDQLLNALFIVTRKARPGSDEQKRLVELLQKELSSDLV